MFGADHGETMMEAEGITLALARIVDHQDYDNLESMTARKVSLCVLDALSNGLASDTTPWARHAAAIGEAGSHALLAIRGRATLTDAICANATAVNSIVRDDVHPTSASHFGAAVIPAVLAVAAARHLPGSKAVSAIVAGYEVGGRIGEALIDSAFTRHFRPTGYLGGAAAAAAVAQLIDLDRHGIANAIGIGVNAGAGFNAWAATGGNEVYFQTGNAARAGAVAAFLAERGAVSSTRAIEGEGGLFAAFGRQEAAFRVPANGDATPQIHDVYFKSYPGCGAIQSLCQALDRAEALPPAGAIRAIDIAGTPFAIAYPGCDHSGPYEDVLYAKGSFQFCTAAMLTFGALEPALGDMKNAGIADLVSRTRLSADPDLAWDGKAGVRVRFEMQDGSERIIAQDDIHDLTPDDIVARFNHEAQARLECGNAAKMVEYIMAMADVGDMATVDALLQ